MIKKKRLEREMAMAKLFRKQLIYQIKNYNIIGEIIDWDFKIGEITIQERVKENEDGIIFKCWTFDIFSCEVFDPSKNNLNVTPFPMKERL